MAMQNMIQGSAQKQQTAMAPAENPGKKSIQDLIKVMAPAIKKALPTVLTPERFTRMTLSALSSSKDLQSCTPESFLAAMMTAAQLGVEPNTPLGQAYLLPYKNYKRGVTECQFQLGYKGLLDLAYRSGMVSNVQAHTVYSNDHFDYTLGLDPKLEHVPARGNRGDPTYYSAVVRMKDGGYCYAVMSKEDAEAHAKKYSKAYNSGPWQTNFNEMAKKTVLKKALKYAPMKSDFQKEIFQDGSVKTEISDDMYTITDTSDLVEVSDEELPAADPATGEVIAG